MQTQTLDFVILAFDTRRFLIENFRTQKNIFNIPNGIKKLPDNENKSYIETYRSK